MDNLNPIIWGHDLWKSLYYIIVIFPNCPNETHKIYYKNFLDALNNVLPCMKCRLNFSDHLKEIPYDFTNKKSLMNWFIKFYNKANNSNLNRIDFEKKYITIKKNNEIINENNLIIIIILLIIVIFYLLFSKNDTINEYFLKYFNYQKLY